MHEWLKIVVDTFKTFSATGSTTTKPSIFKSGPKFFAVGFTSVGKIFSVLWVLLNSRNIEKKCCYCWAGKRSMTGALHIKTVQFQEEIKWCDINKVTEEQTAVCSRGRMKPCKYPAGDILEGGGRRGITNSDKCQEIYIQYIPTVLPRAAQKVSE